MNSILGTSFYERINYNRVELSQTVDLERDDRDWKLLLVGGHDLIIDTVSSDIHLPPPVAGTVLGEARTVLRDDGFSFVESSNHEILIHDCDIEQLDEILPVLEFSFTNIDGGVFTITLSGRHNLRRGPSASNACNFGIIPARNSLTTVRLGSSVFRKYIVGFSHRDNRAFFCLARDPLRV